MRNNSDKWLQDGDEQHRRKRSGMFRKVFSSSRQSPSTNDNPVAAERQPSGIVDHKLKDYETLRESIYQLVDIEDNIPRFISVTSCYRGEGVSTVAVNLARTYSGNGIERVLVVDANFYDPTLHTVFGIDRSPGLSDIIEGRIEPEQGIKQLPQEKFHALPAGEITYESDQKFGSKPFAEFLAFLKKEYDVVIFDTPPLEEHDLSAVKLGSLVDGVILVIEAERVRWEVVQNARDKLVHGKAHILGAVLNKRQFHVPRWLYKTL